MLAVNCHWKFYQEIKREYLVFSNTTCPIRVWASQSIFLLSISFLVKAALLVQRLVELLFLSLVKFHGHQFLSALAHPAQGRPHGFPAEAQNPAHVGRWGSGRALSLRHTPASEGRAGGPAGRQSPPRRDTQRPGCPGMPRDAPGCSGMPRDAPAAAGASPPARAGAAPPHAPSRAPAHRRSRSWLRHGGRDAFVWKEGKGQPQGQRQHSGQSVKQLVHKQAPSSLAEWQIFSRSLKNTNMGWY